MLATPWRRSACRLWAAKSPPYIRSTTVRAARTFY